MHIGIAGAGLMGRLLGWQLLRAGHQVTLFDRDHIDGEASAARVAAAMLAPFSEVVNCERQIFDWGLASLELWPQLLKQLTSDSAQKIDYQQRGSIVVAHQQDQAYLDQFNQLLQTRASQYSDDIDLLTQNDIAKLEPTLAQRFNNGTFLRREGCIDNWGLLNELASTISRLGGNWHSNVDVNSVGPNTIISNNISHRFDLAIDTRGLGSKPQLSDLRGVRGEVLWVKAPEVHLSRPVRLMHPRYQLYIAPKPNQLFVIGATEIESESMSPITVRSSLELQSALYSIDSGFAEANIVKAYANCRPAFIDNLPRIDYEKGLMRINGLYRHGYLLSPTVLMTALNYIGDSNTSKSNDISENNDHSLIRFTDTEKVISKSTHSMTTATHSITTATKASAQ